MKDPTQQEQIAAGEVRADASEHRADDSEHRADTSEQRADDSEHRADRSAVRADQSEKRADRSALRADRSEVRADVSESRADEAEARADRRDTREAASGVRLDASEHAIEQIIEGVGLMTIQVTTLNERVYTKNYLDKVRNRLIVMATCTFIIFSIALGSILFRIESFGKAEAKRANDRAAEATATREQLADCQVPPGVVLPNGTINPGKCFTDTQTRTKAFIDSATSQIESDVRRLLIATNDAAAANKQLSIQQRSAAASQASAFRRLTPATTTTTTAPRPAPAPPPTVPPTTTTTSPNVVCQLLRVLRAC